MTRAELESKHLSELHALAAEAGVPRYRMLRREELIERLAGDGAPTGGPSRPREGQEPRRRRRGGRGRGQGGRPERGEQAGRRERPERERPQRREQARPGESRRREERPPGREPRGRRAEEEGAAPKREEAGGAAERPARSRRRRRRRFGRRRKELRLADLAVAPGRQTIVYAGTREDCTALLRGLAAELARDSKGPDPVAVLVDPGPEELAEWRREAPQAEIVAAAQARHAEDALAQAARRAESGEPAVVLVDSLTRLAEIGNADDARGLLESAAPVTVVAALERR